MNDERTGVSDQQLRNRLHYTFGKYSEFLTGTIPLWLADHERSQSLLQKIILLDAGALALTVPLYKEIIGPTVSTHPHLWWIANLLAISWVLFGISILLSMNSFKRADALSQAALLGLRGVGFDDIARNTVKDLDNRLHELQSLLAMATVPDSLAICEERDYLQSAKALANKIGLNAREIVNETEQIQSRGGKQLRSRASSCLKLSSLGIGVMLLAATLSVLLPQYISGYKRLSTLVFNARHSVGKP